MAKQRIFREVLGVEVETDDPRLIEAIKQENEAIKKAREQGQQQQKGRK